MVALGHGTAAAWGDPVKIFKVLVVASLTICCGCTSASMGRRQDPGVKPAWPPGDPRIRFERALTTDRDVRGATFFSRLVGQGPQPLFQRPYGVAWDGDDLLVTDPGAGTVVRLEADNTIIRMRPTVVQGPIGVAACLDGVVVADGRAGRVGLFDRRLRLIRWLAEDLERPTGVACIADGVAVVETAKHRVVILDGAGGQRSLGTRGGAEGEFNFPAAIAAAKGTLWVGDTLNFRIQGLELESGSVVEAFGRLGDAPGETPRVKGLAIDRDDRVWASDAHLDRIALYDRDGRYLMELGGTGSAPGEFSFPAGIAIHPDGRVAIVDSLNRRVQVLRIVDRDNTEQIESRQP